MELDSEFHKVLYEASNSRILQHMLTDFHNYVRKARKTSVEKKESGGEIYCRASRDLRGN